MARISKSQKNAYFVQLPNELVEKLGLGNSEVKVVEASGFITLVPEKTVEKMVCKEVEGSDMQVLKKICAIPFSRRDEAAVKHVLDENEMKVLEKLVKSEIVELSNGTYNIKDRKVFEEASEYDLRMLGEEGYLVLEREAEARDIAERIRRDLEDRTLLALRGFDGKYYFVVREFHEKMSGRVLDAINGPTSLKDMAEKTSLKEDLCGCIIEFLRKDGLILERGEDTYVRVE